MLGSSPANGSAQERRRRRADAAFRAFPQLRFIACTDRARQSADVQQLTGILHRQDETYSTRPYDLHGIVDRIGAGDAFAAGVLHGLINGFELQRVVDFGTAAACLKHSIPGDFNLASAADVDLVLTEQRMDVRR